MSLKPFTVLGTWRRARALCAGPRPGARSSMGRSTGAGVEATDPPKAVARHRPLRSCPDAAGAPGGLLESPL